MNDLNLSLEIFPYGGRAFHMLNFVLLKDIHFHLFNLGLNPHIPHASTFIYISSPHILPVSLIATNEPIMKG